MTWEESAEFLRQSIESHDRQLGELVETVHNNAKLARANEESVRASIAESRALLDAFVANTQLNFDRLTQAMLGLTDHTVDHSKRISRLEGRRV